MHFSNKVIGSFKRRASAALVLLFLVNACIPIIASATSLFNLQFDPVSGTVYGYIYSDKAALSVSVNDETYGTKAVTPSSINFTNPYINGFYYELNGVGSEGLKGLKPVTAVVYEGSTPVYSTVNNVSSNVYTYSGSDVNLTPPTNLVANFEHGHWRIKWDSLDNLPFIYSVKEYRNGIFEGQSKGYLPFEWGERYEFNAPPVDIQLSVIDIFGNESALSEKVTLVSVTGPEAYHYSGVINLNGVPAANTKFDIKNAAGVVVESFTYTNQEIKGQTQLGRYGININQPYMDYAGKHLDYYFDLPDNNYSVTITNSQKKIFQPTSYVTDFVASVDYEGFFANVFQHEVNMNGNFKTKPDMFTNKDAGHWYVPNEEIVSFTPTNATGNRLDIDFPYDSWPMYGVGTHNTTTIQNENLIGSDLQLIKVSDQSEVGITSLTHNPSFSNEAINDKLVVSGNGGGGGGGSSSPSPVVTNNGNGYTRPQLLSLVLDAELEPNEQYVLKMSSSSDSNEIRLPQWSGTGFSTAVSLSVKNNYLDLYTGNIIDSYYNDRTVQILPAGTLEAVAAVTAKITALPATSSLVLANETAVKEAKAAFDLLTTAQKALVTPENQTKLTNAVAKIASLKATSGFGGGGGGFVDNSPKPSDDGAKVDTNNYLTKEKGSDGKEVSRVKLDSDVFTKALDVIKGNDNDHQTITLDATGTQAGAKIEIPAASLTEALKSNSNIVISIQSDAGTYQVPVSIFKDIAKQINKDLKDVKVTISVTQASAKSYEALQQANPTITTLLANPIEFTITAESGSTKVELNDFSGTYVERKIIVPSTVDSNATTVVSFDPVTGKMTFIPAVVSHVNGKSEITIKSPHNSIYTLVKLDKSFSDISTHWAKTDIELLASKFVVQGMSETTFAPDQRVTRAQFASMLVTALALNPDAAKSSTFTDVKSADWFAGAVGTAAKLGLVEGNSAGEFDPHADITREQMAVMISRALMLSGQEVQSSLAQDKLAGFADSSSISAWATSAVAQSLAANIVNGLTEQSFGPKESATRAQATVMLKRFLQFAEFIN
ncbi:S-layer homology domain-containing protein [Paenibacillus qinlingensis]|uniref:S-layer homology domain-containing protein n=1 Tax=Paenibacillus qinlingensis TaxID=1837343 RepID=UPI00156786B1|nr:S-layer homology domain-containing protein [Paenibacillus qinlingensis]NQX63816.1 S-layer homology domain-containing protein [Paenibacillus qinlingensis]